MWGILSLEPLRSSVAVLALGAEGGVPSSRKSSGTPVSAEPPLPPLAAAESPAWKRSYDPADLSWAAVLPWPGLTRCESQEEELPSWADESDVDVVYPICVAGGCRRRVLAGSGSNGGRCCCRSPPLAGGSVSSKCGRPWPRSRPSNAQSSGVVAAGIGSPPEALPTEETQASCKSPMLGMDGMRPSPPLPPPPPSASKTRAPPPSSRLPLPSSSCWRAHRLEGDDGDKGAKSLPQGLPPSSRLPPPSSSCWRAHRLEGDEGDTGAKCLPQGLTLPEVAEGTSDAKPPSEARSNGKLEDDRLEAYEDEVDRATERTLQKPSTKGLVEV
mmetsp:Transcript_82862/g.267111  ORF Transcript_82862/g.267111 Transcript_82862/m.267111 type:complete len:328 (-) Transcript_82862:200-1183(-)